MCRMWPCQTIDEEKDRTLAFLQSLIYTIQHLLLILAIIITTQSAKLIVHMKMTNGRQSDTFRFNSFASISTKKGQADIAIATANLSPGFDYT